MAIPTSRTALCLAFAVFTLYLLPTGLEAAEDGGDCVYTVYVRTGSIWRGGTDSSISVTFTDYDFNSFYIANLTQWGGNLQGKDHDYFERGSLDVFSGLGVCLESPICSLFLESDGNGEHHGWYVNYVEVTGTGAHLPCSQHLFTVERWLATDITPYSLTYDTDECVDPDGRRRGHSM